MKLPVGELVESGGGRVRVTLALNARTRDGVAKTVDRLDGVAAEYFWVPARVDDARDALVLDYTESDAGIPFAAAAPRWRANLAVHLPEIVQMAVYLASCAKVLEQTDLPAVIAPAYLRYMPGAGGKFGAWRLMVVPHLDVALADWATSAPAAWAWAPGELLLGKPAPHAGAYAIGAALYAAIAGDLYPDELPAGERFARALRRRIGRGAGAVTSAIRGALPKSFDREADALAALIDQLLETSPPTDWREQLTTLAEQLSPYRTAVRWEYEHDLATARGILERFAASAAHDAVPWDVLSRLRSHTHDGGGALDAAIHALAGDDPHAIRDLAAEIRRLAAATLSDRASEQTRKDAIARAVSAADRLGDRLGDLGRLHFAHIEARYLQRFDAAAARLAAPMATSWDNVLRATILARIAAGDSNWALVAKLCKEARLAAQGMEHGGGQLGAYLVAYVDHLDGVAHFGAVGVYNDPLYMADAFTRFVASLDATRAICAPDDPLVDGNIRWLAWIGAMAHQMKVPDANAIRSGVEAYLSAQGLGARLSDQQRREVPPLVWYDASRLLALSGAP